MSMTSERRQRKYSFIRRCQARSQTLHQQTQSVRTLLSTTRTERCYSFQSTHTEEALKESFYDDTFQDVKIKKPSGELVTIEAFCFDGMINFSEEEYVQLMDAIKERGEYKVSMKYKTDDTHSSYRFKFNN